MDFVMRFLRSKQIHDSIWVDRLTKSMHFLPIKQTDSADKLARLHVKKIVILHGVPKAIISNKDGRFTSQLWIEIQKSLGTQLYMSTTFILR